MKAKLFACFLTLLFFAYFLTFLFAFAIPDEPAIAQLDIVTGALVASAMFSDESSSAGMFMKVYVDTELGKKIDNLEIRKIRLGSWSTHASIREEFQRAVRRQKHVCQLVVAIYNLDKDSLTFYYVRVE